MPSAEMEHDPFTAIAWRYAERMQEHYGSISIFGMPRPIPLADIYVRVNVLPKIQSSHRSSVEALEHFFDRDKKRFGSPTANVDGLTLLSEPGMDKVFVLGKPGAGKTTFLKWLALQALARKLPDHRIPLFISLKGWNDSKLDLPAFCAAEFERCGLPDPDVFVNRRLEAGGFFILCDGLDEITGDVSASIAELRRFTETFPINRFVFSCRIAAYNHAFEQFADVEMADFTQEQIDRFAEQWFSTSPAKANLFRAKLAEPHHLSIRELASTPLLLTMLCLAFDELMDFPRNRSDLYGEAIDALLKKWDSSRSIHRQDVYKNLSPRHKQDLLGQVAFRTFPAGRYFLQQQDLERMIADYIENLPGADAGAIDVDNKAVLKSIETQHGLVVERAQGIYSFSHLTFQEYFTARHLLTTGGAEIDSIIAEHMSESRWREVFVLLAEMLPLADSLLTSMRRRLSAIAIDANLGPALRAIEETVVLPAAEKLIPRYVCRAAAIAIMDNYSWHAFGDRAQDPAFDLIAAMGWRFERGRLDWNNTINGIPDEQVINLDEACGVSLSDPCLLVAHDEVPAYLWGTQLIVDCLRSEAYVTASLRKSLLEGLCLET
jgi:predicted NACHT family NTPase